MRLGYRTGYRPAGRRSHRSNGRGPPARIEHDPRPASPNWGTTRWGDDGSGRPIGGVRPLSLDVGVGGRVLPRLFRQAVRVIFGIGTGRHGLLDLIDLMPVARQSARQ